jgi:hypothetical protein
LAARWSGALLPLSRQAPHGGSRFWGRLEFGVPTALFKNDAIAWEADIGGSYDVSADGQGFVVNTVASDAPVEPIQVVLNWTAGLKR